jgi:sec-independent protein translocase protein TatA
MFTPLFIGGMPGGLEMALIFGIAVLLFGANKIPALARSSGEAIGEFKKGREQLESEISDAAAGRDEAEDIASSPSESEAVTNKAD